MKKIGRYEILREIGRGAMGVVYLARDPVIDRQLAIKTIRLMGLLEAKESGEFVQRFYQEARAAGRLSHPGIVTIHDAGFDGDSEMHFIAMEYIPGRNLKEIIKEGAKLGLRDTAAIIARVAAAIGYAHQHSIVHRDIKPANIIINEKGDVKITDFGIAKVPASHLTADGQYLGTPSYMSPEQILGNPVDGRSDIFSLGIVFYELLTGKKPFPGDNMTQVSHRIAYDPPLPAIEMRPDAPPEFDRIITKALAKEPGDRYQDAFTMAAELHQCLGQVFKTPTVAAGDATVVVGAEPAPEAAEAQPAAGEGPVPALPEPATAPFPKVDEGKTTAIPLVPQPAPPVPVPAPAVDENKTAMIPIVPPPAPPAPVPSPAVDENKTAMIPTLPAPAPAPVADEIKTAMIPTAPAPVRPPAGSESAPAPPHAAPPPPAPQAAARPTPPPPLPRPVPPRPSAPPPLPAPPAAPKGRPAAPPRPARPSTPPAPSPAPAEEKPAAVAPPASSPKASFRRRFIAWFSARKGLQFLSYEIYFRWVLAVIAAWTILCAILLGALYLNARAHSGPGVPESSVPAVEWRQQMQRGVALLGQRDFAGALDKFQGVLMQVPDSPALRALVKRALAEQEADLLAKGAGARLEYYLQNGEEAFKRRDTRSAKEFFLSALDVDPENTKAKEYLAQLEAKPRVRKPVPPAPAPLPSTPVPVAIAAPSAAAAPAAEPAPAGATEALVTFESPVPKGYVTVNLDGAQAMREEFNFYRKKGFLGKEFVPGTVQKNLPVTAGEHEVKAWVSDTEGKYTAHASARHNFRPGRLTAVVLVLQPASKTLQIQFKEQ